MKLEAGINGPIIEEAVKGLRRTKNIEAGRAKVPNINSRLNELFDKNVLRDSQGGAVHNGRGWSKISLFLKPEGLEDEMVVNLIRHVTPHNGRIDVFVEGLDSTFHISRDQVELRTLATVPQRGQSFGEFMHTPTGSSIPEAPAFDAREATLKEVEYIEQFVDILCDPSKIVQIKNKLE